MHSAQDISLNKKWAAMGLISLVIASVLFFYVHPDRQLKQVPDKQTAADYAENILQEFGFPVAGLSPDITLMRHDDFMMAYLQKNGKFSLRNRISNNDGRAFFYYWEIRYRNTGTVTGEETTTDLMTPDEPLSGQAGSLRLHTGSGFEFEISEDDTPRVNLMLSLDGELLGFRSNAVRIQGFRDSVDVLSGDDEGLQQLAERQAAAILEHTYWSKKTPELHAYSSSPGENDEGFESTVEFIVSDAPVSTLLKVELNSEGKISSLSYEKEKDTETGILDLMDNVVKGLVVGFFMFVVILFYFFQFFKRFYHRLLDMRLSRFDAIAFSLIIAVISALAVGMQELQGAMGWTAYLIIAGVFAATFLFVAAVMLPAFATTDSLSQEAWPEKKHSITLLKHGFIKNSLVGLAIFRGVVAGCVIAALLVLLYLFIPSAWLTLDDSGHVFFSTSHPVLPFIIHLSFFVTTVLMVLIYMAGPAAWLQINKFKPAVIAIFLVLLSAPLMPVLPEAGNYIIKYGAAVVLATIPVILLLRYDLLTSFTAVFSFTLVMSALFTISTPGYTDLLFFMVSAGLFVAIAGVGYVGMQYDYVPGELPDLEPGYIKKLVQEQRIKKEFELAREVHDSFLNTSGATIPGFDISANCKTAYEVGGDYFDFIEIDTNRTLIVIADVSGKGVKAAFYMTLLKGYLQTITEYTADVGEIMRTVNRLFYQSTPRGTFITAIAGVLDRSKHTFTFIRAGHDPLYLLDKKGITCQVFRPEGFAIGMAPAAAFDAHTQTETITLQPDQAVILFTDGYPESFNSQRKQLGEAALEKIAAEEFRKAESASHHLQAIHSRVQTFVGNAQQHDDMTMVVIHRIQLKEEPVTEPEAETETDSVQN